MTDVKFVRVLGVRARRPTVLAIADDHRVRWDVRGWSCTCPAEDDAACEHVEAVAALLDPRVTGETSC